MKHNPFVVKQVGIGRAKILVLLVGLISACSTQPTANNPNDVASPTPQPTVTVASPTPQPTVTVATPVPQPTVTATNTVVISPAPQPTATSTVVIPSEPITDVVIITRTDNPQILANKRVQFTDVKVQNVSGDRTFWVGPNNTQQLFVVLDPTLDSGNAEEKIVVKTGQTVSLTGLLRPMPSIQQAQTQWGLSAAEAQALKNQALYLQAEQIKFR